MKDFFNAIKDDIKTVLQTRLAWLITGLFGGAGQAGDLFTNIKALFGG